MRYHGLLDNRVGRPVSRHTHTEGTCPYEKFQEAIPTILNCFFFYSCTFASFSKDYEI